MGLPPPEQLPLPYLERPLLAQAFVPPLLALLLLRHPRLVATRIATILRIGLLPLTIYLCLEAPIRHTWQPVESAALPRYVQGLAAAQAALKAVEWATVKGPYHRVPVGENAKRNKLAGDDRGSKLFEDDDGPWCIVVWTLEQASSLRGIGWSWGIPRTRTRRPWSGMAAITGRIVVDHIILVASVVFIVASRDLEGCHSGAMVFERLGLPVPPLLGGAMLTIAFGFCLITGIDLGFAVMTLIFYAATSFFHWLLPSFVAPFDLGRYPPMFDSPHLSTSIGELWAKRWHALFDRTFRICAYKPTRQVVEKLGGGPRTARAIAVSSVFLLSGLMHEFAVYNAAAHRTSGLPSSLLFFLAQPVAIVLFDPVVARVPGPRVLKTVYVWIFLVAAAGPFRAAHLDVGRLDGAIPSDAGSWSWVRWLVPLAVLLPA